MVPLQETEQHHNIWKSTELRTTNYPKKKPMAILAKWRSPKAVAVKQNGDVAQ